MKILSAVCGVPLLVLSAGCGQQGNPVFTNAQQAGSAELRIALGVYHLPNQVDVVNLSLGEDGSFFWNACGCDFMTFSQGFWFREGDTLKLLPPSDAKLTWFVNESFGNQISRLLTVTSGPSPDEITISGEGISQVWRAGRMCAVCGSSLGPTGQQECSEPLIMNRGCH